MVLGTCKVLPLTLTVIVSTGGGAAGAGALVGIADILLAQSVIPVTGVTAVVHDREHMDAVVQFFVNEPIREPSNTASANGRGKERKPLRPALHSRLGRPICAQESPRQFQALALIVFGSSREFDIGFAMEDQRLHPIAA